VFTSTHIQEWNTQTLIVHFILTKTSWNRLPRKPMKRFGLFLEGQICLKNNLGRDKQATRQQEIFMKFYIAPLIVPLLGLALAITGIIVIY